MFRIFVVECHSPLDKVLLYYGNATSPGAHFPFNFLFIETFNQQSDAAAVHSMIKYWMQNMLDGTWPNWIVSRRTPDYILYSCVR